jgi:rhamnose utilization protein RhaD (predicted bifunctional aldolase and dehydrogenase)/NAD(P)-dependent dehydrogenase (short-subunit alcohol dehydrogenase family)
MMVSSPVIVAGETMKSLWNDSDAQQCRNPLELRAYTSRLLGQEDDLVLHGGGNTSVKDTVRNIFGEAEEILYVKGSGHDLKTIGTDGFAPTQLAKLQKLAMLDELSDIDMMRELKTSQIDPKAPAPSVEAILHAIIPFKYVDHTHTDAVVTITNTRGGESKLKEVYGDDILVLPYMMPGFILARQVYEATKGLDWSKYRGIILLHHGVFTYDDDARTSYENMIDLVSEAEAYIDQRAEYQVTDDELAGIDALEFAKLRKTVSDSRGGPVVARFRKLGLAGLANADDCGRRGPITPDHVLHTKRVPMLMSGEGEADVQRYTDEYQSYFDSNSDGNLICLDKAPRWGLYKGHGIATFGINGKRLQVCSDIIDHTSKAIQWGEQLNGWEALPEKDIFELEYWELEQAKLKNQPTAGELEGRVAVVTGAASGIGKATAGLLIARGACVAGIDIDPAVSEVSESPLYLGIAADLTATDQVKNALETVVLHFGGIDVLFSNAGSFPASAYIEELTDEQWDTALSLNLDSHFKVLRAAIPYLREGIDSAIVINASKNALAPGPGVGAYSVAKAALAQLARVAALELAGDGVRVNVLHPDAVFDTGIWTDEVLAARAEKYGLTVEDYKRRNLLATEISSSDVAAAVLSLVDSSFAKSTGMQLTIDGGNDRTI